MSQYRYVVLGAGRQGTAAAYDLARMGQAAEVVLADVDLGRAQRSAQRVNDLLQRPVARAAEVDVSDASALQRLLAPAHGALSAVPYFFNLAITRAAIAARTHLCDMGGHTPTVFQQLEQDPKARQAGVSVVPDCGMGPGLINTIGAYIIASLDQAHEVRIYDGGLPKHPRPPWNYNLLFHINGLTNEYYGTTVLLRDGELVEVEGLTEYERLNLPPLGELEAFITTGGASTAPWTFRGKVRTYINKTLRYPGHYEWFRAYKALGLFELDPVEVNGQPVVPREVFHTLLAPKLEDPEVQDVALIHVVGTGIKEGKPVKFVVDVYDEYDPHTGFRAMERLTGWHCSTMLAFQVQGIVPPGAHPQETAVPPERMLEALRQRGIAIRQTWAGLGAQGDAGAGRPPGEHGGLVTPRPPG